MSGLGVVKVPGLHCFQMLLDNERYQHIIQEVPGTHFLNSELILNFEPHCVAPLKLHDDAIKDLIFEHHESVLYVRQPPDPDLALRASEVAEFLHLSLQIQEADYSHLEKTLIDLL